MAVVTHTVGESSFEIMCPGLARCCMQPGQPSNPVHSTVRSDCARLAIRGPSLAVRLVDHSDSARVCALSGVAVTGFLPDMYSCDSVHDVFFWTSLMLLRHASSACTASTRVGSDRFCSTPGNPCHTLHATSVWHAKFRSTRVSSCRTSVCDRPPASAQYYARTGATGMVLSCARG